MTRGTQKQLKYLHVNIGPQHPSTHGVLRLKVALDGEVVRDIEPVIGYLHRSVEKLSEDGTYLQVVPLTDRNDYLAAMHNNMSYVYTVEQLLECEVPEYADHIRVLVMELNRIASHQVWLGTYSLDLGALTPFFWCFRDREMILQLLEEICGARMTFSYFRFGGVRYGLPEGWVERCRRVLPKLAEGVDQLDRLLTKNDILMHRLKGIGHLSREACINYGITGPMLRAAGLPFDLRKDEPYSLYERFEFDIPTETTSDCYARYRVRLEEMRQSIRIVEQALDAIPSSGPIVDPKIGEGAKQNRVKPRAGVAYGRIEAARGELGCLVVSDGSTSPYRVKFRSHCLSNLQPLKEMVVGSKIPDLVATLGSIDIVLGDIDR